MQTPETLKLLAEKKKEIYRLRNQKGLDNLISLNEEMGDKKTADLCRIANFQPPKHEPVENFCEKFITQFPPLLEILKELNILAYTQDTVLLRGPTGVGKEVLATCLGPYREGNFVSINCATITEQLAESILFGHVKGAFTGAVLESAGLFTQAKYGVLFLDEIFELSLVMQAKLLRVLETKKARAVGSPNEYEVNCRIVMASCRDDTTYREDFYARICGFEYHIPSLAERPEDAKLIMSKLCPDFPPEHINANHKHNVRRLVQQARRWTLLRKT